MKKTLLLILFTLFLSAPLYAQSKSNQHLKFMGIPIDGSITNFQNKLIAKGFKYDKVGSQNIEGPTRIFKGQFAGESSQLFVYYDRDQKFVYSVGVCIDRDSEDDIINLMSNFISNYENKYGIDAEKGDDTYDFYFDNGRIRLFYDEQVYSYGYTLYILYTDYLNYNKYSQNNMDDL